MAQDQSLKPSKCPFFEAYTAYTVITKFNFFRFAFSVRTRPFLSSQGEFKSRLQLSIHAYSNQYVTRIVQGPEFIFPVEVRQRSWNEKMFERTGTCYVSGQAARAV